MKYIILFFTFFNLWIASMGILLLSDLAGTGKTLFAVSFSAMMVTFILLCRHIERKHGW